MKTSCILVGLALVLPVNAQNPRQRADVPVDVSAAGMEQASMLTPTGRGASSPSFGLVISLHCVQRIADQSTGGCLMASSRPAPGMLFPPPHDGGVNNTASGSSAFLGGGRNNLASGPVSVVGGGSNNTASGNSAVVGGGYMNTAQSAGATVGGGGYNATAGNYAAVGGGRYNYAAENATVAGGDGNTASGSGSAVGGGTGNTAFGAVSAVGGGENNMALGGGATIAGGVRNMAALSSSAIGGGLENTADAFAATVGGGWENIASASHSTVPGGRSNTASGNHSFAAGRRALANHDGAFVWGDGRSSAIKTSSTANEFNVYASGGARFFSNLNATTGVLLAPGGGSWTAVSDRAAKENIEPVNVQAVLESVVSMPVSTWNYREQSDSIRHMGPMAQDFYAAFELGLGEKTIDTIDPDGVALAAIQGLHAQLAELRTDSEQRQAELEELRAENQDLRERLEQLEGVTKAALTQ